MCLDLWPVCNGVDIRLVALQEQINASELTGIFDQYAWGSAHVIVPIVLGAVIIVLFILWEGWWAKYPMFPRRLKQDPRILSLTLLITFISGANFFSFLMFWPTQAFNVYGHDPVMVGIRVLPAGMAIMVGACITLWLLSVFRGRNKELMIAASCLMTAGKYVFNRDLFHITDIRDE